MSDDGDEPDDERPAEEPSDCGKSMSGDVELSPLFRSLVACTFFIR